MASGAATSTAVALVPDRLYAVGGTVPLDGRISWMSATDRGHQPVSGSLLTEGSSALLVDTGVALHEDDVIAQLGSILDPTTQLDVFFTRAELDCVGNLGRIANTFPLRSVRAGGVQNPFDSFDSVGLVGSATAELEIDRLLGGESIALGGGGRTLEVITPAFKMLNTFWAYDEATATLFTSDVFGHTFLADPAYRPVVTAADDGADYDQLRRNTIAKFWWLDEVVTERIGDEVEQVFAEREIERIAPAHGCVLAGRDVVQRHIEWLLQLLRGFPGDPRLADR
jgi:flavorubredoxin